MPAVITSIPVCVTQSAGWQSIVITIGTLVALKQAFALDLTSIAVIFTALSVGIGFGLQYIAADIASGFILLFERPIRVGDRITIGEDQGDVQSINLRRPSSQQTIGSRSSFPTQSS